MAASAATAAVLGYMTAAAALDTGFCNLIGSISIFNLLFFHNFHIFSLFNILFFCIFHIFSLFDLGKDLENTEEKQVELCYFSSIFSLSFHYSTYFSSIFSISFHNFLLYFPNLFTIQLAFLPVE
jgi:hypothetical protein